MMREDYDKGFFVAFDYSSDSLTEVGRFFNKVAKSSSRPGLLPKEKENRSPSH